jgi:hypothetical protein
MDPTNTANLVITAVITPLIGLLGVYVRGEVRDLKKRLKECEDRRKQKDAEAKK